MTDFYTDREGEDWLQNVTDDMILAGQERTNAWAEIWQSGLSQTFNNQRTGVANKVDKDGQPLNTDIQVNYSWPAMMQETAIQAQRRPLIVVEPHDEQPEDSKEAEIWQGILQHQYLNALGMPELNNAASIDAFVFGLYIAKVYWEAKAEWDLKARKWIGKPQTTLLFPLYFGADPEAEKIDLSTSYVYSGRRVDVDWVLRRWGETKEMRNSILHAAEQDPHNTNYAREMHAAMGPSFWPYGTSETELASSLQHDGAEDLSQRGSRGRLVQMLNAARGFGSADDTRNFNGRPKKLTLFEVYFRDLTEGQKEDVKPIDIKELLYNGSLVKYDDGSYRVGNPEAFKKSAPHLKEGDMPASGDMPLRTDKADEPTFPRGRFVLKIGKDLILNPLEKDQVYPYKQWPYMTGVFHELPHIWEGLNGTEMLENLQTGINTTYTSLLNLVTRHGNPILEVDKSALAKDSEEVVNEPGAILNVKEGKLGKAAAFLQTAGLPAGTAAIAEMLDRHIQGQSGKHDQAIGRSGKPDTTATEVLTKQENDLIRSALQIWRRDVWNTKIMNLVVEMDQANLEPGRIVQMTGKEFDARRGKMTQALLDLEFAIKLQIGTGLPFDKERKKQDMERLAAILGPIPVAKQLLEAFEVDKPEEILALVEGYQEFLAFLQQREEEAQAQEQEQPAVGAA